MTKKKTVGQQIVEHDALRLSLDDDIIEYRRAMEPEILKSIDNTIQKAVANPTYKDRDFYVVLIMMTDRVLKHFRYICVARLSCPTPTYKQAVWKYHHTSDSLEFLWSIPDKILYYHLLNNKEKYLQDKECSDLLKFVILMESGELLTWVKKENGEKKDAVIFNDEARRQLVEEMH